MDNKKPSVEKILRDVIGREADACKVCGGGVLPGIPCPWCIQDAEKKAAAEKPKE